MLVSPGIPAENWDQIYAHARRCSVPKFRWAEQAPHVAGLGWLEYLAFCLDFLAWIIYLDQSPLMNLAASVSVSCRATPLLAVLIPGSYQLRPWRTRMLT